MNITFLEAVIEMSKTNLSTSPNYKVSYDIARHPNVKYPDPSGVAFGIDIDVNENFINDPDYSSVIDAFVKTLNNVFKQIESDFGYVDAVRIFPTVVRRMNIKYSY